MADEEQSFTFVDKRHTSVETPVSETEGVPQETVAEAPDSRDFTQETADFDAETDDGTAPDIYGILSYFMSVLASEAWQKLGLIADARTGQVQADLVQAKVAIDAAGDLGARLEAAPPESVPETMKRELRTLVRDLRLNFVTQQAQPK